MPADLRKHVFDVEWINFSYQIDGPFEVVADGVGESWQLQLREEDSPIAGGKGRFMLSANDRPKNGNAHASMTIYLVELPPLQQGKPVKVKGDE